MRGFDRHAMGWDLRFAEFLILAPVSSVVAFAAVMGLGTAGHGSLGQGLGTAFAVLVGGLWVMAAHYVVASLPSILTWGLTVRLARSCGLGPDAAMRLAALATALMASLLLLLWLRDEDYRAMIPTSALASAAVSLWVAERIIRSHSARGD